MVDSLSIHSILMRYPLCLIFLCALFTASRSQQVDYLPVQFGQFFNMYSVINPASCGSTAVLEVQSGRQQHGGAWKNISTTFVSAAFRMQKRKANNFHVAGVSFISDKEGQYLSRSKFYLTYAWHTRLTKKLSLSAGTSAGYFSYLVSESSANVSGGAMAPDASFGLWLYSETYYFGASVNQIFNSKLTPLQETTTLIRHYNLTAGYSFALTRSLSVKPSMLVRYASGYPVDIDIAAIGAINRIFTLGVNYRHNKSIVPVVGFEKLAIGKGNLKAMFSYAVPAGKIADNLQTYELTLNYDFKPVKKKNKR